MMHDGDVDDSDDDTVDYKHQHNQFKIRSTKSFGVDDYYKEN